MNNWIATSQKSKYFRLIVKRCHLDMELLYSGVPPGAPLGPLPSLVHFTDKTNRLEDPCVAFAGVMTLCRRASHEAIQGDLDHVCQ